MCGNVTTFEAPSTEVSRRSPDILGVLQIGDRRYFVKRHREWCDAREMARKMPHLPPAVLRPYVANHAHLERFAALVGEGRVNLAPVRLAEEISIPERIRREIAAVSPQYYLSQDIATVDRGELPQADRVRAMLGLFVYSIFVRHWDVCEFNMGEVAAVPICFDLGDTFNEVLLPLHRFDDAVTEPHAAGHLSFIRNVASAFQPDWTPLLMAEIERFASIDLRDLAWRAHQLGLDRVLVRRWLALLGQTQRTLRGDAAHLIGKFSNVTIRIVD